MTVWQVLQRTWTWEPSVIGGCLALAAAYFAAGGARRTHHAAAFVAGVIVLFLALDSPLDTLGDTYLFSVHMVQHLLLILIVPPLLLLGVPPAWVERARGAPLGHAVMRTAGAPGIAWSLGIATMVLWHVPALYDAALARGSVHVVEHLSFLATGAIFWWPVLTPVEEVRLGPLPAVGYLVAAALASSVLGIVITFAGVGLYPPYLLPIDRFGIEPLIRDVWGLPPDVDQEVGGLLMWIPGGLVYLCAILGVMSRWYRTAEHAERSSGSDDDRGDGGALAGAVKG
jgi:putative membrane protein